MCKLLSEYMYKNKISQTELAKKAAISVSTISMILAGKYQMGRMVAEKLELATEGEIPATYLLDKSNQGFGDFSNKRRDGKTSAEAIQEAEELLENLDSATEAQVEKLAKKKPARKKPASKKAESKTEESYSDDGWWLRDEKPTQAMEDAEVSDCPVTTVEYLTKAGKVTVTVRVG